MLAPDLGVAATNIVGTVVTLANMVHATGPLTVEHSNQSSMQVRDRTHSTETVYR